jgi:murein DD-endopeptidase MepM/ murein hydrolase activator NlpD
VKAAVIVIVVFLLFASAVYAVDRLFLALGARRVVTRPDSAHTPARVTVDLRPRFDYQILPRYVDVDVGDTVRVIKADGAELEMRIVSVEAESRRYSCPRTRVNLHMAGRAYVARSGMAECDRGGIGPIEIDGVKLAVEVTKLVFSRMRRGSSPFNAYRHLRLRGDLRLAIWEAKDGIMRGVSGAFVVAQPVWTRGRYGNWLHITNYGLHSAIDIYVSRQGVPEPVLSPVAGTVYRVYNKGASADDRKRSKAVNIYGDAVVGPDGERVLYRFQHLSRIVVSVGEKVERGQMIGYTGHTGFEPEIGDHLHFEIRLNPSHFGLAKDDDIFATVPVNPYNYLFEWYESGRAAGVE